MSVDTIITVTFSEGVYEDYAFKNITLEANNASVTCNKKIENSNKLILAPQEALDYNTKYTVTIPVGAVKDAKCNSFAKEKSFSFTTIKFGDMNIDNSVNILDLLWMADKIGPASDQDSKKADVNSDDQVNILDLLLVAQNIGN